MCTETEQSVGFFLFSAADIIKNVYFSFNIDWLFVFHREEKAIELYKQLKAKCKSECV